MNIGPRSNADLLLASRDPDIYVDEFGRHSLAPDNLAANPFLVEVDRDGTPLFYDLRRGRQQIGNHAYISQPNRPQTQSRQNISTLPMSFDGWPQFSPVVNGARKPVVNHALQKANLVAVVKEYAGFRGGEREGAFTWSTARGSETLASSRVTFVTSQGNKIEWTFEDEPPPNARWRNLYLTDPGTNALCYQERIPAKKREHTMVGPFRHNGRRAPSRNSTYVGSGPLLTFKTKRPTLEIAPSHLSMQDGIYLFRIVEVTKNGPGFSGPPSEERVVEYGWIWNHERDAEGRLTGKKIPLAPAYKHAIWVIGRPGSVHPDCIGIQIIVQKDGVNYILDRSNHLRRLAATFPLKKWFPIYGYQTDSMEESGRPAPRYTWTMSEYTRQDEDFSGIPDPVDAPPAPVGVALTTPGPGTYTGSYAPVFEDEEYGSAPYSAPQDRVVCDSSHIPEVQFPSLANVLKNAEFGKVGATGKPLNWIWASAVGEIVNVVNGVCQVSTGLQQNTSNLPRITSYPEVVDANDIWTFRGRLRVKNRESGSVRVAIKEWADETRTTEVGSYAVAVLSSNDEIDWTLTYGPVGSGADRTWNDAVGAVGYVIQAEGNPHSLTLELEDFAIHPFEGGAGVRKYGLPEDHSPEDPNPQASDSFYPSNLAVVAEPPVLSTVKADTVPPIQRAYFENVIPGGYSLVAQQGSASHTFTTVNPITGKYILRVSDTNASATVGGVRIWQRAYPAAKLPGGQMAVRMRGRFLKRPTKSTKNGPMFLSAHSSTAGNPLLWRTTLHRDGWLFLHVKSGNTETRYTVAGGIVSGDEYDIEVIALKVGGRDGNLVVKFAKNGGERRTVRTIGGINWNGLVARLVNFGVWREETPSNTWQFEFDELVVTRTGDVSEPVGTRSPGVSFPKPDRPYTAGEILQTGGALPLDRVEAEGQSWLGVKGSWNVSGPPPADSLLLRIDDGANNPLAAVRMATNLDIYLQIHTAAGIENRILALGPSIGLNATHGAEIVVSGAGSSGGRVDAFYYTPSGSQELRGLPDGIDWEDRLAKRALSTDKAWLSRVSRSTRYELGARVLRPDGTETNSLWYEATTAGTTAPTAPTYPTTAGWTISDGTNTAQVATVEITPASSTVYTVTINGVAISYTSDADATEGEIALGLVAAINGSTNPNVTPVNAATSAVATSTAANFTVTADVAGVPFTLAVGANLAATITTPNSTAAVFTARDTATGALVSTTVSRQGSVVPRQTDPLGNAIKQFYMFKHPLIPQDDLGMSGSVCAVVPGQTYTVAWLCYCRFAGLSPGQYPLYYYLRATDGSTIPLGSVFGRTANTLDGSSAVGTGAVGATEWADRWFTFAVPARDLTDPEAPVYNQLVMERGTVTQGIFVFQEQLVGKGSLVTEAQRDEKRTYRRAAGPASVVVTMPFGLPVSPIHAYLGHEWGGMFAGGDVPDGTTLGLEYSSSPDDPPIALRPWSTNPVTINPEKTLAIKTTLSRDDTVLMGTEHQGSATPLVAPDNLGYKMFHRQSTLLDEDSSPLPGGSMVNGVEDAIDDSDINEESVAGAARPTPTTPKHRVFPRQLEFHFFTARAHQKFLSESIDHDWTIEAPHLGESGMRYRVRFYGKAQNQGQRLLSSIRDAQLRRHVWGSAVVARVQVIEEAEMR